MYLNTLIAPQILRQYSKRYFRLHSNMVFQIQNNLSIEKWEKLGFSTFKE